MKELVAKWNSISLVLRIVVGLAIGAIIGLVLPSDGSVAPTIITLLGTLFVNALKAVAPILVFFLIISALCNAKAPASMRTIIVLYLVSTFVAALVAVVGSFMFPMELTLASAEDITQSSPSGIGEVLNTLLMNIVMNPVKALVEANYIGILVWAAMIGAALRVASQGVKEVFSAISDAVATIVRWIISLAPFGILGLVYDAVATNGMEIFIEYGQLIALLVVCMIVIALVTNPLMVFILTRKNPYPLVLRCLKDSGITAFFTRSSAANIPVNMELCEKLGLDKNLYSVSIPLGATINMAGAAVTISVMAMQAANTVGLAVDVPTAVILSALAAISACGIGPRGHLRMRRLGRARRLAAAHPDGLLALRHRQRRRHASRGRRLHHWRGAGLVRDGAQLVVRRAVHGNSRVPRLDQGRTQVHDGQGQRAPETRRACK